MSKRTEFSNVGPVHFQPLSAELIQIRKYIGGSTLNAGCGNRDITEILLGLGANHVVNYDIESSIPNARIGSLENVPFESCEFETIICNAVLEHVPGIENVMAELVRVLKPDGKLIVGMPFLQPYHLCPTDFRRYTRDGLIELGQMHELEALEILPLHNIAQTVGWIVWEWAKEKGQLYKLAVYPFIWLTTRLFYKTDFSIKLNANTYQVVYVKKQSI